MIVERVHPKRRQLLGQLLAPGHRERRGHADVMQPPVIVVQPEQQRSDQLVLSRLVPAEAGDDAVGGARVLDLDHRALAGLVGAVGRLHDHAVEPRAFELRQPLDGLRVIARHRCEVDRRRRRQRAAVPARRGARVEECRADPCRRSRSHRTRRKTTASPARAWRRATRPGWSRSCSASKSRPRGVAITISPSSTQPSGNAASSAALSSGK